MPKNLIIRGPQDLSKLEDWTILKASPSMGQPPKIILRITHPAASTPVDLIIVATANVGLSGNVLMVAAELGVQTADVENEESQFKGTP